MSGLEIAIVGAGPVGGILGAHLVNAGERVTLIDLLHDHIEAIRKDGLHIAGEVPEVTRIPSLHLSIHEAARTGPRFEIVFVCVKATAVRHIAPEIELILTPTGVAVSFQNGLETEEQILTKLGPARTLRGVVNYAGNIVGPGRLRRTFFNPPNWLGSAQPGEASSAARAREIATLLTRAGLETRFADDVQHHVWEKAIRNAALMPVSALTGQNMAQVMASRRSLHLVEELLREEIAIARAAGHDYGNSFFESTLEYYRKAGTHVPSMRGDVLDGRQTEIEYLNHKIAEVGERLGVACPYNRAIANLVLCVDEVARERRRP